MKKKTAFRLIVTALTVVAAVLASSCSFGDWNVTGTVNIALVRSGTAMGARAASDGGTLALPDFHKYELLVEGSYNPIKETGTSVTIPLGPATFTLKAWAGEGVYTGSATATIIAGTNNVAITMNYAGTGASILLPFTTTAPAAYLARIDDPSVTTNWKNPNIAGYFKEDGVTPASFTSFVPADSAVDAEGFVYLADSTLDLAGTTISSPRIIKIKDLATAAVSTNVFLKAVRQSDAGASDSSGISTIAIDRANGYMYYGRRGEAWFYKKSLKIMDGEVDLREESPYSSRIKLPADNRLVALDCLNDTAIPADNGTIFVLSQDVVSYYYYVSKYTANPDPASATPILPALTSMVTGAMSPADILVRDDYVWVLDPSNSTQTLFRFGQTDLATQTSGGSIVTDITAAGQFSAPLRFLTSDKGNIVVQVVSSLGKNGIVSFTDMAGWVGWTYKDIQTGLGL